MLRRYSAASRGVRSVHARDPNTQWNVPMGTLFRRMTSPSAPSRIISAVTFPANRRADRESSIIRRSISGTHKFDRVPRRCCIRPVWFGIFPAWSALRLCLLFSYRKYTLYQSNVKHFYPVREISSQNQAQPAASISRYAPYQTNNKDDIYRVYPRFRTPVVVGTWNLVKSQWRTQCDHV
jgi:hypothetical protein